MEQNNKVVVETNRNVPHASFFLGLIILFGAVAWWLFFYGPIIRKLNLKISSALSCLYSDAGFCSVAVGMAQLIGTTPYSYFVFWFGLVVTIVGFFLPRKST